MPERNIRASYEFTRALLKAAKDAEPIDSISYATIFWSSAGLFAGVILVTCPSI